MYRILFVLSAITGACGAVMSIFSVVLDDGKLLNAGLLALLITALFTIGMVVTGRVRHSGQG